MIPLPMLLGGIGGAGGGGGFVLDYDVNDVTDWPAAGIIVAIDVDPVNNRLFLCAQDRTASVYLDHIKVYDINPDGTLTEVYSETITLLPNESGSSFAVFRSFFTIIYSGSGKVRVPRFTGMATYDYDETTGALTLSSNFNDLDTNYPSGRYGLQNGIVMSPGGVTYYVSSAGRNSFLQAVPIPDGLDQSAPINTARETYYNSVSKLSEGIFYVADAGGGNLTRNSIDSAGAITELATYATGMATSGLDDGDHVHNFVYQDFVYVQQTSSAQIPPLQPTRRWPITDDVTGTLGAAEDGTWDFRGDLPFLKTLLNPGQRSALTHNGHTYFIRQSDGNLDQLLHTA